MSANQYDNLLATGELRKLKTQFHRYEPLLEYNGRFQAREVDGGRFDECLTGVLEFLVHHDGLEVVDRVRDDDKTLRCIYEWRPGVRDALLEYSKRQDRLPCGHRAHIYNDPNTPEGMLGCRYCAENGEHVEIGKETVRDLL